MHYTLDCTTPDASSPVYTGPIRAEKNTVIRAVSIREGYITNSTVSGTFLFVSDNVDHSVPIVTLVTDPDNLWDSKTGIYAYGDQFDPDLPYGKMLETANYYKRIRRRPTHGKGLPASHFLTGAQSLRCSTRT